jgi:hypothetical protein
VAVGADDSGGAVDGEGGGMSKTTVANIRTPRVLAAIRSGHPDYVYCGRANRYYNLPASKWHNPFVLNKITNRPKILEKYEQHLLVRLDLMRALPELRGKILVCWCAPEPCHCDVLARLADKETI